MIGRFELCESGVQQAVIGEPIYDPATPAARPANRGFRCINEGCMAGAGWAFGAALPGADCGAVAEGVGVADCSIGFAPFWS
jgi:hypothetical protein